MQRWAPALFSRSRAGRQNKSAKARRKKSAKKSESAEREGKKARIRAFSPTHSGNPVLEHKATRQGGKPKFIEIKVSSWQENNDDILLHQ
jgi:hypothetical protein